MDLINVHEYAEIELQNSINFKDTHQANILLESYSDKDESQSHTVKQLQGKVIKNFKI